MTEKSTESLRCPLNNWAKLHENLGLQKLQKNQSSKITIKEHLVLGIFAQVVICHQLKDFEFGWKN